MKNKMIMAAPCLKTTDIVFIGLIIKINYFCGRFEPYVYYKMYIIWRVWWWSETAK